MILWTIQNKNVYDLVMRDGIFRQDGNNLFCEDDFRFAYDWLNEQMKNRLTNKPAENQYPVWAWYQWEGVRKRPDMRTGHKKLSPKGTPIVLLTIDVPDDEVVLSDFDLWHFVLMNSFIRLSEEEDNDAVKSESEVAGSWKHIFDLNIDSDYCTYPNSKSIQATFWQLRKEQIIKAEFFTSS